LWGFYFAKGDLVRAADHGQELLSIATDSPDKRFMVVARQNVGYPLTQRGHPAEGLRHLDEALELDVFDDPDKFGGVTRVDSKVRALVWSSMALLLIGKPDQAQQRLAKGLDRAAAIGHPFTHAFACSIAGWCFHHRRQPLDVQRIAEKALALSTEYSLGQWVPISNILLGWVMADQGQIAEGIGRIQKGVDAFKRTGAHVNLPQFFSMLAEAHVKDENFAAALAAVDEGLALADRNDDIYWRPELLRLRGAIHLRANTPNCESEAELAFQTAIATARTEQARILELRATASLSRLWQWQGKHEEALSALSQAYAGFTEGFDSNDLRDARALLDVLEGRDGQT